MKGWRPSRLDVFLALSVASAGLVESYGRQGTQPGEIATPGVYAAGALTAGALLVVRNRFPISALLALIAVGQAIILLSPGTTYYAAWHMYSTLILVHTVASRHDLRSRIGVAGLCCVVGAYAFLQTLQVNDLAETLIIAIFLGVAYGSGILLRRQTAQTTRLAALSARLEVEREERARRAVAEERARIARDLHDVISHNVSVMTLHAGAARMMLGAGADRERELLLVVEQAGREAVGELALMLGMLREAGTADGSRAGLDRLDELVAQMEESGVRVELRVDGPRRPLPPGVDLSAYRVVQESLTNVRKHAGASSVGIVVTYAPEQVTIEVTDDGRGPAGSTGGGYGQIGMRERVALHGGSLAFGAAPGGGYSVLARFPSGDPSA